MSDTYNLIDAALKSVRDVYEQDTESTVKQLEAMRQVNTAATLRYIKKEEDLKKLSRKAKSVEQTNVEIREVNDMLTSVEARLASVEQLVKELDEYTENW